MKRMIAKVRKIYDFCQENNLKMLSNFNADFWEVYRNNSDYFDRLFRNSYREFVAFNLQDDADIEEAAIDWIYDVTAFLKANEKRYAELWRMQTVADIDYSILDNYHVSETHATTATGSVSDSIGAKTETKTGSNVYGSITDSESNSYVHGAKSETDGETLNYGLDKKTTGTTVDIGAQQNTSENKVSAFNDSNYSPKDYNDSNLGTRHDVTQVTETRDARADSTSGTHTEASYTDSDTKSKTRGSHTDTTSDTIQHGAQSNSRNTSDSENKTVTKSGNMGIYSNSKLLAEHEELWKEFNFYKFIFDEIADEFLRIVYF